MTLTEFLLARKTAETEQVWISLAASDAVELRLTPEQADDYLRRMDRSAWVQWMRLGRAFRNLAWAIVSSAGHPAAKHEAARWSSHPDYDPAWRP